MFSYVELHLATFCYIQLRSAIFSYLQLRSATFGTLKIIILKIKIVSYFPKKAKKYQNWTKTPHCTEPSCQRSDIEIKSFPLKKNPDRENIGWSDERKKFSGIAAPPHYYLACFLHACFCTFTLCCAHCKMFHNFSPIRSFQIFKNWRPQNLIDFWKV